MHLELYEWATFVTGSVAIDLNGATVSHFWVSSYNIKWSQRSKDIRNTSAVFLLSYTLIISQLHAWNIMQKENLLIYQNVKRKDSASLGKSKKYQSYICLPKYPLVFRHKLFVAVKSLICLFSGYFKHSHHTSSENAVCITPYNYF